MSLYFSCPHKHVYNRKKLARRTIWRDYIDQIRIVATALNICENNIIFYCNVLEKNMQNILHCNLQCIEYCY